MENWPNSYKVLKNKSVFYLNEFSLIPIRLEDKYVIMKWRNEQIYHLRQEKPITKQDQDNYFEKIISPLFNEKHPKQILFSFLKSKNLIGYGGLVHINWELKKAEISFVMDTSLEKKYFNIYWNKFLKMIEYLAFEDLNLNKIFTIAFDVRPKLYESLKKSQFRLEHDINNFTKIKSKPVKILTHYKFNHNKLYLANVVKNDLYQLFIWVNEKIRLKNSFNNKPILWEDHIEWFSKKLISKETKIYILKVENIQVGQIRFDLKNKIWEIDYSIDSKYRNKGYGKAIIQLGLEKFSKGSKIIASVKNDNYASIKVFESLMFKKSRNYNGITEYIKKIN